jgi:hypothetical protein
MKKINIDIVHILLRLGSIRISPFRETLLVASFFSKGLSPVSVNSDRGIEHLLALLYGATIGDQDLAVKTIQKANQEYPYAVSLGNASEVLLLLENSYTELSYCADNMHEEKRYKVQVEQNQPPSLNAVAGRYAKVGYGTSLEEAFNSTLTAKPVLL